MKIKFKKLKKGKKIKLKLIALSLIGVVILGAGCKNTNKKDNNEFDFNSYITTKENSEYSNNYNINEKEKNEYSNDFNNQEKSSINNINNDKILIDTIIPLESITDSSNYNFPTSISEEYYNNFINTLKNEETYYKYSELYSFNESLDDYNKLKINNKHNILLSELDSNQLYDIVKKNNIDYCLQKYIMQKNNVDDATLKKLCGIIIEVCKDFIKNNSMISEENLKCVLSDLKIFFKNSFNYAYVTDDNCLVISSSTIDLGNILTGEENERKVLVHEIIHLLQKRCNCNQNENNLIHNFGISYKFNNTNENTLDFTWLFEASAEKNMCNYLNTKPLTYKSMISYLESLSLTNIVKDNYKVNDTEKISFYHNLDVLFDFFDAKTDKEKSEVLKLMYSIEIMQKIPSNFQRAYSNKYNVEYTDEVRDNVNYELKSPICKTLTKYFYKNLANTIKNNNIEIHDIFYLISIFECDINNHITYDKKDSYHYNEEFLHDYSKIQREFFYTLAKSNNVEQEEIENLFKSYTSKVKDKSGNIINNYNLDWLDNSKKEYLNERLEYLNSEKSYSIINVNDYYLNNEKTYKIQ